MKLKFFSFFLLFLSYFSFPLHAYHADDNSDSEINSKEDYTETIKQIMGDLKMMRPSLLMNFCKILDLEDDGFNKSHFYYQQQYEFLTSGFQYLTEIDSHFVYLVETIKHNLEKEQNTFNNATTRKTKNKCLNNFYNGLLGSFSIVDEILNGLTFNQLYKKSKKL